LPEDGLGAEELERIAINVKQDREAYVTDEKGDRTNGPVRTTKKIDVNCGGDQM